MNNSVVPRLLINHKNDHKNEDSSHLTIRVMKTIVMFKKGDLYINQMMSPEKNFKNNDVTVKKANSFFYSVEGKGFKVLYDGNRIYIKLEPIFAYNTRGLCGTFNYKSTDDFLPPSGIVETGIAAFADSYKTEYACSTPKQTNPCEENIAVSRII